MIHKSSCVRRAVVSSLALFVVASGCAQKKEDDAGVQSADRPQGQASGDGCAAAPQQFQDGRAFDRLADGSVRKGIVVKVVQDPRAPAMGAHAGYIATSAGADPYASGANGLGEYGTSVAYGYGGGAYEYVYGNSIRPRIYEASGAEDRRITTTYRWQFEGQKLTVSVLGKKVGEGVKVHTRNGRDIYAIQAVNGACFGAPAVRGTSPGMNGGVQNSTEGGSFILWLGHGGGGSSVQQRGAPAQQQSMPSSSQDEVPPADEDAY